MNNPIGTTSVKDAQVVAWVWNKKLPIPIAVNIATNAWPSGILIPFMRRNITKAAIKNAALETARRFCG